MTLVAAVALAVGSALGGMARYALVVSIEMRRPDPRWPLGTLVVNLSGCFLMGALAAADGTLDGPARDAAIAALGSFTTVSAFALESWQRRVHRATWIGYGLITVIGCLAMFQLGRSLA